METGGQYAMMSGQQLKRMWSVNNLDTLALVGNSGSGRQFPLFASFSLQMCLLHDSTYY